METSTTGILVVNKQEKNAILSAAAAHRNGRHRNKIKIRRIKKKSRGKSKNTRGIIEPHEKIEIRKRAVRRCRNRPV